MTKQRKASHLLIVGLLTATSFVVLTPSAAAHSCTAEEGSAMQDSCEAECTEGEDHSHTVTHHHENGPFEDENHIHYDCESSDPNGCDGTKILGVCVIETGGGPIIDTGPIMDIVCDITPGTPAVRLASLNAC